MHCSFHACLCTFRGTFLFPHDTDTEGQLPINSGSNFDFHSNTVGKRAVRGNDRLRKLCHMLELLVVVVVTVPFWQ